MSDMPPVHRVRNKAGKAGTPSIYSQTKIMMQTTKEYRDRLPFESKLNIMSDEDRKARGIDNNKCPPRPTVGDIKYEK